MESKIRHDEVMELEYNHIVDGIFVGTNKCCLKEFDGNLIEKENIEVDISLEGERVDGAFGVKFYLWLPVLNYEAPTQDQLVFGVRSLEHFVKMKKKCYVHCMNGHGRAPTLVAAYIMKAQKKAAQEAIEIVKEARPVIHLEKDQIEALEKFGASL